jgi:hypothetical protein
MKVKAKENSKNVFDSVRKVMFTPGEEFEVTEERYNVIKAYVEVVEKKETKKTTKKAK